MLAILRGLGTRNLRRISLYLNSMLCFIMIVNLDKRPGSKYSQHYLDVICGWCHSSFPMRGDVESFGGRGRERKRRAVLPLFRDTCCSSLIENFYKAGGKKMEVTSVAVTPEDVYGWQGKCEHFVSLTTGMNWSCTQMAKRKRFMVSGYQRKWREEGNIAKPTQADRHITFLKVIQ